MNILRKQNRLTRKSHHGEPSRSRRHTNGKSNTGSSTQVHRASPPYHKKPSNSLPDCKPVRYECSSRTQNTRLNTWPFDIPFKHPIQRVKNLIVRFSICIIRARRDRSISICGRRRRKKHRWRGSGGRSSRLIDHGRGRAIGRRIWICWIFESS